MFRRQRPIRANWEQDGALSVFGQQISAVSVETSELRPKSHDPPPNARGQLSDLTHRHGQVAGVASTSIARDTSPVASTLKRTLMSSRSSLVLLAFIIIALLAGALLGYLGGRRAAGETLPTSTVVSPSTQPATATPALPTVAPSPSVAPTVMLPTAVAPTSGIPTAVVPTVIDAQPGTATFAFEPQRGGAGTLINLRGWDFTPHATVFVTVGFPTDGPRLASVGADAAGKWQTQVTIPQLQLSPGPDWSRMHIVITDERGTALASAPFAWQWPNGPTLEGATQTVRDLLSAYMSGRDPRPYLDPGLRARFDAGEPLDQVLGLQPAALQSFIAGAPLDRPSEVLFVPATLVYSVVREERIFTLVVQDGQWRVQGSFVEAPEPGPSRGAASETVRALLANFGGGTAVVRPLLASELRAAVDAGTPVHEALGLPPMAWQSFMVDAPEDLPSEVLFVPATLTYPTFVEVRRFTLVVEDGAWRITGSAPVLDPYPAGMERESAPSSSLQAH